MMRVHRKASIPTPTANMAVAQATPRQGTDASWVINQAGLIGKYNVTIMASTSMKPYRKQKAAQVVGSGRQVAALRSQSSFDGVF